MMHVPRIPFLISIVAWDVRAYTSEPSWINDTCLRVSQNVRCDVVAEAGIFQLFTVSVSQSRLIAMCFETPGIGIDMCPCSPCGGVDRRLLMASGWLIPKLCAHLIFFGQDVFDG
jgi:hypothetical protein